MKRVLCAIRKLRSQPFKKDRMRGARWSTSGGVLWWYVRASRTSATKQASLFQRASAHFEKLQAHSFRSFKETDFTAVG